MDRKYIDDNHVVARYLADQLTEKDRERFEAYVRDHPQVVSEMEAAARFKVGLAALAAKGELDASLQKPASRLMPRVLALAASIAVAFVAIALWLNRAPSEGPLLARIASDLRGDDGRALPFSPPYSIVRTRSNYDAVITLPGSSSALAIRVLPEYPSADRIYRVDLAATGEETERPLAALQDVKADGDGFVPVFVRSDALAPGPYKMRVRPNQAADAAPESVFSLKVEAPLPVE